MKQPSPTGAEPPANQGQERRTVPRRRKQVKVFIASDGEEPAPQRGWVVDRSPGGLRLSVSEAVPVGRVLRVRAANALDPVTWLRVEVKSCRRKGYPWELGCQFLGNPPYSQLLLFG
jgi:PilZ domain